MHSPRSFSLGWYGGIAVVGLIYLAQSVLGELTFFHWFFLLAVGVVLNIALRTIDKLQD